MKSSEPMGVPKWEQLGLIDLFRYGPWELVVVLWVFGGAFVYSLLARPILRIISVSDPALAGLFGGVLAGLIAAQAANRRYSSSRSFQSMLYIAGTFVLGALAFSLCAYGPFHPVVLQASSCSPRIALHESEAGYWASWLLPSTLWLVWCRYLFSGFPAVRQFSQLTPHSRHSRYKDYERGLKSLWFRSILFPAVVGAVWACGDYKYNNVQSDFSADQIMEALARLPPTAFPQVGEPEFLLGRVEEVRVRTEHQALGALEAIDLDRARPLVRRAVCDLLLPTSKPSKEIVSAEADFRALDQELDAIPPKEHWTPSPAAVEAIVHLTPINSPGSTKPICPLFWLSRNSSGARTIYQEEITTATRSIAYRGRQILDIRLASVPLEDSHPATLEVAIKVSGTTGDSGELASLLESRLGRRPTEGPQSIGRGSICAHWNLGYVGIRLGPAVGPQIPESSMTPQSPLWITCYDRSLKGALDLMYQASDGRRSWDPHSCEVLPSSVLALPVE